MTTRGDDFTGTAGSDLAGRTATGTNGSWAWGNPNATTLIAEINAANQLKILANGTGMYTAADPGSADQYAQATYYAASDSFPVCVRCTSANSSDFSFYGARFLIGNWELWKAVNTIFTKITSAPGTLTSGDTVKISISGTSITVSQNGSTVLTATDSSLATGVPGLQPRAEALDPWIDNFLADAVGAGPSDTLMGAICL